MGEALKARLEALLAATDHLARRAEDPIAFAHRYQGRDAEVAGAIAAALAFGRVAAFAQVIERVLEGAGPSPREWLVRLDLAQEARRLEGVVYRWVRGPDLVIFLGALKRVLEEHETLEDVFWSPRVAEEGAVAALEVGLGRLRGAARRSVDPLPRGVAYLLPDPRGGSACKRWAMFLRWMVRPVGDGVDLGLWTRLRPDQLVMPLDRHVHRIGRLLGLTRRQDASLRTALEVTEALRALDSRDPVRFDFALAHLGISGACKSRPDPDVCPACALRDVCAVGGLSRPDGAWPGAGSG